MSTALPALVMKRAVPPELVSANRVVRPFSVEMVALPAVLAFWKTRPLRLRMMALSAELVSLKVMIGPVMVAVPALLVLLKRTVPPLMVALPAVLESLKTAVVLVILALPAVLVLLKLATPMPLMLAAPAVLALKNWRIVDELRVAAGCIAGELGQRERIGR